MSSRKVRKRKLKTKQTYCNIWERQSALECLKDYEDMFPQYKMHTDVVQDDDVVPM